LNSGAAKLAQTIAERITALSSRPDALELGTIQGDLSLRVDRFAVSIPKGDYLVAEWLVKISLPAFSLVGRGEYPVDGAGNPIPETAWTPQTRWDFRPRAVDKVKIEVRPELKPGDRVLVAWVNGHTDPVVLCKVVPS
jgi:hypothetical protein